MNNVSLSLLQDLIRNKPYLIWFTKSYETLNEYAIAEAIYNYGSWEDVLKYHTIVGLEQAKKIFDSLIHTSRSNIKPKTKHYFSLYYGTYT